MSPVSLVDILATAIAVLALAAVVAFGIWYAIQPRGFPPMPQPLPPPPPPPTLRERAGLPAWPPPPLPRPSNLGPAKTPCANCKGARRVVGAICPRCGGTGAAGSVHLNVALTPEAMEKLKRLIDDLRATNGTGNAADVFRRALAVYEAIVEHRGKGDVVLRFNEDGSEERLVVA